MTTDGSSSTAKPHYLSGMIWSFDKGSYVLRDKAGITVLRTKQPAILYNQKNGQLYRHGDFERISRYAAKMRFELIICDRAADALDVVVFSSKQFSLAELNRCINEPGYCLVYQTRLNRQ